MTGDLGLGRSCFAATVPAALAEATGRKLLMAQYTYDQIGCRGITEPDHGSDVLDFTQSVSPIPHGGAKSNRPGASMPGPAAG